VTKVSRYVLPAVLVLVALATLPAGAQININTYPTWNGSDTISSFGYPNTATYGEAITTPAGGTNVSSFSFWLSEAVGFQFQAFIAPWDNNNYLIPGGLAGVSYLSSVQTVTNSNLVQYTLSGVNLAVTPGTIYMFGVTIDNVYNHDAQYGAGVMGGDLFAGGNSTYYFAWNNDSGDGSLLGANWNNEGCANNGGSCGQAAWLVTYNGSGSTPEPSSFILLGTGALGLFGVVRRKLKV
jgi:PEP-CTERM motif